MSPIKYVIVLLVFFLHAQKTILAKSGKADSLLLTLKDQPSDTGKVNLLNNIAYEYGNDRPEENFRYANMALQLATEAVYEEGKMNAYNNLGLACYFQNQYGEALRYYDKGREIAGKLGDKQKLAVILNNIGLVYDDKAEYKKALEYYLGALEIADVQNGNKRQLASTLNNVGLIYKNLGLYDKALEYYNRSMKLKEELGNKKGVGSSLHNIALIYKLKGDYKKSLEYNEQSLQLRKMTQDESGMALTLNNIGSVYEEMHEYEKAYPFFVESLKLRKGLKDKYGLSVSLFSLGSNYCSRKKTKEGLRYLHQALQIAKEIGAKDLIRYGYEVISAVYANENMFEEAYRYQKMLISLKDSILNSETTQQLSELQTKYETEKKEKEITLLTKDSQIQALQLNKNKIWMLMLCVAVLLILTLAALFYVRWQMKQRSHKLLEHQNNEITLQKKEITDSINYAKRIQESILPPQDVWAGILPDSFIFYRPKDIVSGDFYWIEQKGENVCFAAVDCTGHGVPGALMSVVGFNLLTQAVNEVNLIRPSEILKHLDAGVTKTLRQSEEGKGVKDGMDLSICSLNRKTLQLEYAGAFNSLYYVSNGILTEIKADKFPIGVNLDGKVDNYTNHVIQLQKGDCVYLYSDGYADQFGGPKGKKFKYNQLKEMLCALCALPVDEQRSKLESAFDDWKGGLEQIDDVLIIGVRV